MPIRFRCAYCNQLMGISRRKAGKVVRCPKCAGEIIVPVPEGMEAPEEPVQEAAGPQAFEAANFEQLLTAPPPPPPMEPPSATAPLNNAAPSSDYPAPMPMPPTAPPKRLGLFLPLGMLIVSLGAIVLLMILMFVLGLVIGRHTMITEKTTALRLEIPIQTHVRSSPATSRSPSAAPGPARNSCRA